MSLRNQQVMMNQLQHQKQQQQQQQMQQQQQQYDERRRKEIMTNSIAKPMPGTCNGSSGCSNSNGIIVDSDGLSFDEQLYYMRLRQLLQEQIAISEREMLQEQLEFDAQTDGGVLLYNDYSSDVITGGISTSNYTTTNTSLELNSVSNSTGGNLQRLVSGSENNHTMINDIGNGNNSTSSSFLVQDNSSGHDKSYGSTSGVGRSNKHEKSDRTTISVSDRDSSKPIIVNGFSTATMLQLPTTEIETFDPPSIVTVTGITSGCGGGSSAAGTVDSSDIVSAVVAMGINGTNGEMINGLSGRLPIQLYLSCNDDYMSQYQCIVRKQIELFEASYTDIDIVVQGRNKPILLGQVGIRCRHCSLFVVEPKHRANGSTYYPSKLQSIYQASQNMAQTHLLQTCTYIPQTIRNDLLRLREEAVGTNNTIDKKRSRERLNEKSAPGGGKQFWASTAASLGVIEDTTNNILRFDPCWSIKILHHHACMERKSKILANQRAEQEKILEQQHTLDDDDNENDSNENGSNENDDDDGNYDENDEDDDESYYEF